MLKKNTKKLNAFRGKMARSVVDGCGGGKGRPERKGNGHTMTQTDITHTPNEEK